MKKTAVKELKGKSKEELNTILKGIEKNLTNEKIAIETKKKKNVRGVKGLRKEIAQIKTAIREKELEEKNV